MCKFSAGFHDETFSTNGCENNLPLTNLFRIGKVNLKKLLEEHSLKLFTHYKETHNQEWFNRLTDANKTEC